MDIAGDSATKRGIDMAQRKGFYIKVVTLPEGKDPAEIIQKNEPAWQEAVSKPHSIGDFYFQNAFSKFDKNTSEGRGRITGMILSMIHHIPSEIEKSVWVQKLAKELSCGENAIWNDLASFRASLATSVKSQTESKVTAYSTPKTKPNTLLERMILLLTPEPSCKDTFKKADFTYLRMSDSRGPLLGKLLRNEPLTEEEGKVSNSIAFEEEIFPTMTAETDAKEEFELCFQEYKKIALREELKKIQQELRNDQKNAELLKKFQKLSGELVQLS
jgi:DNA primase